MTDEPDYRRRRATASGPGHGAAALARPVSGGDRGLASPEPGGGAAGIVTGWPDTNRVRPILPRTRTPAIVRPGTGSSTAACGVLRRALVTTSISRTGVGRAGARRPGT